MDVKISAFDLVRLRSLIKSFIFCWLGKYGFLSSAAPTGKKSGLVTLLQWVNLQYVLFHALIVPVVESVLVTQYCGGLGL